MGRSTQYYSQVLVHATGMLHHPAYPGLPGQQDFTGQALHSARWDQDINFTDKVGREERGALVFSSLIMLFLPDT